MADEARSRPAVVCIVGPSGSGKTTLLEKLIPLFEARGVRVAAVKSTHHTVESDVPGKDSWRLREAGAAEVVLVTPGRSVHTRRTPAPESLEAVLARLSPETGLVLVEGYASSPYPKVLVGESPAAARERGMGGEVLALVHAPAADETSSYDRDDVAAIYELIAAAAGLP